MLVFACLGASPCLAVGPVAAVSTTVLGVVAAEPSAAARADLAAAVMFYSGLVAAALGLAEVGGAIERIPGDVLGAFVTCCALTIGGTQVPALLGVTAARDPRPYVALANAAAAAPRFHGPTAAGSALAFALLAAFKRCPVHAWLGLGDGAAPVVASLGPCAAMGLGALLNAGLGLEATYGLRAIGAVPRGLPKVASPLRAAARPRDVAAVALVALTETLAMGRALARGGAFDGSQDALALGVANALGSFFQTYAVAGSFEPASFFARPPRRGGPAGSRGRRSTSSRARRRSSRRSSPPRRSSARSSTARRPSRACPRARSARSSCPPSPASSTRTGWRASGARATPRASRAGPPSSR